MVDAAVLGCTLKADVTGELSMQIIKRDSLFDIAEAFGLGRESMRQAKYKNPFGSVVFCMDIPQGFVTRVCDDPLRRQGSVVAVSDGYDTTLPFPWQGYAYRQDKKGRPLDFLRLFQMYCATFAATGVPTKCGIIPERIFLFVEAPGFNLTKVIGRLRQYRHDNPVPLFPDMLQHIDFNPLV